jgi:outer membrane protein TolC
MRRFIEKLMFNKNLRSDLIANTGLFASIILLTFFIVSDTYGQVNRDEIPDEITITLDEAIEIALINNYMLRKGLLDIETADQQIREAWGSVYPQVNASGSYTRNVISPNPFAGSDAGGLFELFGSIEWLAYNENARTDDDPDTEPISFDEFLERQSDGLEEAGITIDADDNPFAVDNQFQVGVSVSQTLYNGAAFAAIRGARQLRQISQDQFQREQQQVVDQIKGAYYGAILAQEQVRVLRSSVERLKRTVEETRSSVEAGILSRYDSMSAEVELVNLETNLIEVQNQAELAVRSLTLQLGIPVRTKLNLRGELEFDGRLQPEMLNVEDAYRLAIERRPDVSQVNEFLKLLDVNRRITRSGYLPVVSAFANAFYIGQVPDNRQQISTLPGDQFSFTATQRRFFDDAYWDPSVAVGIQFQWSIFDGFQTSARVQQNQIEIRQAEIDQELLKNSIYLEVDQAIKDLETAYQRIVSQERNIEQAQLNHEQSLRRLREGVGTPLEERQASSLLDQSRLNYLSAVYDYKTAVSRFNMATGQPVLNNN